MNEWAGEGQGHSIRRVLRQTGNKDKHSHNESINGVETERIEGGSPSPQLQKTKRRLPTATTGEKSEPSTRGKERKREAGGGENETHEK